MTIDKYLLMWYTIIVKERTPRASGQKGSIVMMYQFRVVNYLTLEVFETFSIRDAYKVASRWSREWRRDGVEAHITLTNKCNGKILEAW